MATVSAYANDEGYEVVFVEPLKNFATAGDLLIAISSSGRSQNVLTAVATARERDCKVVTFSGFDENNALRRTGDVNFYLRSHLYGFVEVGHLSLCHAILDLDMGWSPETKRL